MTSLALALAVAGLLWCALPCSTVTSGASEVPGSSGRERWRRPKFCGDRDCPPFHTLHCGKGYEERKYWLDARWVLTNESVVTFNHAYLLGKVRLANYFAGGNDRKAHLHCTNPLLARLSWVDGELEPFYLFAAYLPRECQHDPPLPPKHGPANIGTALNRTYWVRPFHGLPTLGKILGEAEALRSALAREGRDYEQQALSVAIYEPAEVAGLEGRHPQVQHRYNEVLLEAMGDQSASQQQQ